MTPFNWPDARGWVGIGTFTLLIVMLGMLTFDSTLRQDEFFKTIGTLIAGAFLKDVVGWAFSSTKTGGEIASKNADALNRKDG